MSLNFYKIHQVLGGKMVAGSDLEAGPLGVTQSVGELLRTKPSAPCGVVFDFEHDKLIVEAFESVRNDFPTDRLLWDKKFAKEFRRCARSLGLNAPDDAIVLRLLNIRKNPARYAKKGIELRKVGRAATKLFIRPHCAHAIEFALVR
ncbi:MAG: hypothetical protein AAF086_09835, partial [Planctomycetota bacterium]